MVTAARTNTLTLRDRLTSGAFDGLMESLLTESGTFIVDNGASTFIPQIYRPNCLVLSRLRWDLGSSRFGRYIYVIHSKLARYRPPAGGAAT
ncbi:MAG: hypothetical protein JWP63_1871 [Candidatus Solibacter sp.]|nr:hypothetical protein [Candidatus Solibacter sp.]